MATEEDVVKRALAPTEYKGIHKFLYEGESQLIDVVKARYPAAAHLFICNLDNRDTLGNPLLMSRRLRGIKLSIQSVNYGFASSIHVEAVWHEVFAVIEKGMATIKVARFSIGETES